MGSCGIIRMSAITTFRILKHNWCTTVPLEREKADHNNVLQYQKVLNSNFSVCLRETNPGQIVVNPGVIVTRQAGDTVPRPI